MSEMTYEQHPWGAFLKARWDVIKWMEKEGRSDSDIAWDLSMDEKQVYLIRNYDWRNEGK